jgi:hypothetical protein
MALAQTSLDIDLLTIARLYNKSSYFSTGLSYIPVVSTIGTFHKWVNKNNSDLFVSVFYTYSNGDIFFSSVSSIQLEHNLLSSSVYLNTDAFSEFISTNKSEVGIINNILFSTISSYNYNLKLNSSFVSSIYSSVSRYFSSIVPGVSTTLDVFYDNLFSPIASTIIKNAIDDYIPLTNIHDFTYNIENNNPYFNGIFGSNIPLPSYWQGSRRKYIGSGLSSISTLLDFRYYDSITSTFPGILNNFSVGIYDSNARLDTIRSELQGVANNAERYLESGSTVSNLLNINSTSFQTTMNLASTFGSYVSTFSSIFINTLKTPNIPTLGGFSIKQYISTADLAFNINQTASNNSLYSTMSSLETLIGPYTFFSTLAHSTLSSYLNSVGSLSFVPGIQEMSTIAFSVITPFIDVIDVSTNYNGYLGISSYKETIFSSYSTTIAYTVGSNILTRLNIINSNISTISTSILVDYNSNVNNINSYITLPGISEIASSFSTNLALSYNNYAQEISSIIYRFSTQINIVNATPGLSSLNSSALVYDSTNMGVLRSAGNYINSGFEDELEEIRATNINILSDISTNVARFISAGLSSFNYSASTFTSISTAKLQEVYTDLQYIQLQSQPITGEIYPYMSNTILNESATLDYLAPFSNSTIYYKPLPIIANYSTSLFAKGRTLPTYISRSTTFLSIVTDRAFHSISSFQLSTNLAVQTIGKNAFSLNICGSMSIQPSTSQNFGVPNLKLPTFNIFTNTQDIYIPQGSIASLSSYDSTIAFYYNNLSIKRLYRPIPYSYTGINTLYPGYSLDIFVGDARKPMGVTWVTASDERVKQHISTPDTAYILRQISSLRLVSYNWTDKYKLMHNLSDKKQIGFISQEVKTVFPRSVTESEESGYSDFHSLDVDQIYKAKLAATRYLINKIANLQVRISTLMKS